MSHPYEAVFVFSLKDGEEATAALTEKFKALVEQNADAGSVGMDEWGKRRLAYPIHDELEGHYVLINFAAAADFPAELDRVCKITDGVLRWLVVRKDEKQQETKEASDSTESQ